MTFLDKLKGVGADKRGHDSELADEVSYVDALSIVDDPNDARDTVQDIGLPHGMADPHGGALISESAPSPAAFG